MLSIRENFMRLIRCEMPEYVSTYSLYWGMHGPSVFREGRNPDGTGKDMFGVEWVIDNSAFQAALPKPGDFVLDDIRKWRDVIQLMDLSGVDWEAMAKKDCESRDPDIPFGAAAEPSIGFFQTLMALMGFTNGLVACFEEPEEVKALMEYLCDYTLESAKNVIHYYKPDYGLLGDDIAHERNPFISLPMFRELFVPSWSRYTKIFREAGLPVVHHNCGHFEEFVPEIVDMGITAWDPVQPSNDAVAIKAKYGSKLALCGAWVGKRPNAMGPDAKEEEVRASVKTTLDTFAPGGGFAVTGISMIRSEDPIIQRRNDWVNDEYEKLKFTYYN